MFPNLCSANAQDSKCDQNTVFAQGSQNIVFVQYRKCDQNIIFGQDAKYDQDIVFALDGKWDQLHQVAKYDRNTDLLKKVDTGIQIIEFAQGSKFKT